MSKDNRSLGEILLSIQVELANTELVTMKKLQALRVREQEARTAMAEQQAKFQDEHLKNLDEDLAMPKIGMG